MAKQHPDDFDPYHKWLGIPKKRRPPTHYDLLGLSLNEDDAEVIRSAAEQRRRHVESKRGSGRDSAVAGVLYQIEEAELTLLDPELRRDYDRRLNLFRKRQKQRQVDPHAPRTQFRSRPGKTIGEGSGIVGTFLGIMAVLMVGFGVMAWFSFQLPWSKPPIVENVAEAAPAEVERQQPPAPSSDPELSVVNAETSPVVAAESIEPVADERDGFTMLFDGQSLNGWQRYTGGPIAEGWVVENGMLCLRGKGGDIATDRQFGDFELEFEWRMDGGNSGVLYRVRPDDPHAFQSGPEYQIVSGHDPIDSERAFATAGSLYGIAGPASNQVNAPDQFNHSRIVVQGNHVQHWLNGQQVVDIEMHSPTWNSRVANSKFAKWRQFAKSEKGHICLQDAGAEVCFRNIRIRELDGSSVVAVQQQSQTLSEVPEKGEQGATAFTAINLETINSPQNDLVPWVSPDGLEIFWHSADSWTEGAHIYSARRMDAQSDFVDKRKLFAGTGPVLSVDGLHMYFQSPDENEIHFTRRDSRDEDFERPEVVPALSFPELAAAPRWLSHDGLTLYLDMKTPEDNGRFHTWTVTRETVESAWKEPERVYAQFEGMPREFRFVQVSSTHDGLSLYCSAELAPKTVRIGVLSRKHPSGPYTQWREIALTGFRGDQPVCLKPQFVEETNELFFASNGLFSESLPNQPRHFDLWVVRNFQ